MVAGKSTLVILFYYGLILLQDHAALFPTLARIALELVPCQASSVPCEVSFQQASKLQIFVVAASYEKHFDEEL